jgi:hypothetical protein
MEGKPMKGRRMNGRSRAFIEEAWSNGRGPGLMEEALD